jgi:hypothetical protein
MVAMVPVLLYAGGFLAILEVMSTASHLLSYARLMALGLAGAMLAQVSGRLSSTMDSVVLGILVVLPLHLLHLVMNLSARPCRPCVCTTWNFSRNSTSLVVCPIRHFENESPELEDQRAHTGRGEV